MVPLFPLPLPVIVVTGKHQAGKTLFGLTINPDPKTTCIYDLELSSVTYSIPGLERVTIPEVMRNLMRQQGGYKPIELYKWWVSDVRERVKPGRYRVVVIDPISELEDGITEFVRANPELFGATAVQYQKMQGIMWGHVKALYKQILTELAACCETLVIIVHMGKEWSGGGADAKPTGRLKPKGKETLFEVASLYLEMQRNLLPNGSLPEKPSAVVHKSRLAHMVYDEKAGDWQTKAILPPRLAEATPRAIRAYIEKPADYSHLRKSELIDIEKPTEEDILNQKLALAEAEKEAARDRLIYAEKMEAMRQAAAAQLNAQSAQQNAQAAQSLQQQAAAASPPSVPAVLPADPPGHDAPVAPGRLLASQLETLAAFRKILAEMGMDDATWGKILAKRQVSTAAELTGSQATELIGKLQQQIAAAQAGAAGSKS